MNNVYEEPGRLRPEPPPPPPLFCPPDTTTAEFPASPGKRGEHNASKQAPDPLSYGFEETFTGPAEPRLPEGIERCFKLTYSQVLNYTYTVLSLLIGPILVVVFGIIQGLTSFTITWVLSPTFRCAKMFFAVFERFFTDCFSCILAPLYRTVGQCLSRMVIRYQKVPSGDVIHI